ncbi:hypothetical protein LCGC14_2498760 [marine sediment metagenome]|uniref:Uncharacterized protein n=1 Tax=marine sediment metagenome TaxID=412755 RepID=A0A0F9B2E6_9ZZZZ
MPTQIYICPQHGKFEAFYPFEVSEEARCPWPCKPDGYHHCNGFCSQRCPQAEVTAESSKED